MAARQLYIQQHRRGGRPMARSVPNEMIVAATIMEDDANFPAAHSMAQRRDGVEVGSMRPILKAETCGLVLDEFNKVEAGEAGPAEGTTTKERKAFAAAVIRMEAISGMVADHEYGEADRPFRSNDVDLVVGGVRLPKELLPDLVVRSLYQHGFDTELYVEAGRQAVDFQMGRRADIDLSGFESQLAREARLAREAEEAQKKTLKRKIADIATMISPFH